MDVSVDSIEAAIALLEQWQDAEVWDAGEEDFKLYMNSVATLQAFVRRDAFVRGATEDLLEDAESTLVNEVPRLEEGFLSLLDPHCSPLDAEEVERAFRKLQGHPDSDDETDSDEEDKAEDEEGEEQEEEMEVALRNLRRSLHPQANTQTSKTHSKHSESGSRGPGSSQPGCHVSGGKAQQGGGLSGSAVEVAPCFVPENVLSRLSLIVKAMGRQRQLKRCCQLYKTVRRPFVLETIRHLSAHRFNPRMLAMMQWSSLQRKMGHWQAFLGQAVAVVLASERRTCQRIFNHPELSEYCFSEATSGSEKLLFEFPEGFCALQRSTGSHHQPQPGSFVGLRGKTPVLPPLESPEWACALLGSLEGLLDLQPAFNAIFAGNASCKPLRNELSVVMSRIAVAVRTAVHDLDKSVQSEATCPPQDAGLHPLTTSVLRYLKAVAELGHPLAKMRTEKESVVVPVPKLLLAGAEEEDDDEGEDIVEEYVDLLDEDEGEHGEKTGPATEGHWGKPLPEYVEASTMLANVLRTLEEVLGRKARSYYGQQKQREKEHFFLMNNLHHVAMQVKDSKLRLLLGDDWIRSAAERVRGHANEYMALTWNRLGEVLRTDAPPDFLANLGGHIGGHLGGHLGSLLGGGAKNDPGKTRLIRFCSALDEVYIVQSGWHVVDRDLKHELINASDKRIVPLYESIYSQNIRNERQKPGNIHDPEVVKDRIRFMYQG